MRSLNRRNFVMGTLASAGAVAVGQTLGAPDALAAPGRDIGTTDGPAPFGPYTVTAEDVRYGDLIVGGNQRFVGTPDYVTVVGTPQQAARAIQRAVSSGRKVAVRSGGHCYEDFVANPSVHAVVDLSEMNDVYYDPAVNAFAVEAGARLEDVYARLFKGWGVVIPAGNCPTVGAGGHIIGGGYGSLSRLYGLVVDHLYAVEVATVDASGTVSLLLATRDADDPNHDLWWAHTGGGGGNFGVVTRYFLRSPGASGTDPGSLLPRPPASFIVSDSTWQWSQLTQADFERVVRNFCGWYEENSAVGSTYLGLFSQLKLYHESYGSIGLTTQLDATLPNAEGVLDNYYAAMTAGVSAPLDVFERRTLPWWHASLWDGFTGGDSPLTLRYKAKSAYHRRTYTDPQLSALYAGLTDSSYSNPATLVLLAGYGGQINAVAPTETAAVARDSVLKVQYANFWTDSADDDVNVAWLRQFYRSVYSSTGGVPVPDSVTGGTFINYADADVADPEWNASGVSWQTLYYGQNYPRLQRVKHKWDPRNMFNHTLSIEA
jgi:hypothetical protein